MRYIGMDTPEAGMPCAAEATAFNRKLVEGKTVFLEKDVSETDKYGRLLRYVWVDDLMVNAELVSNGYAQVATYPPDVKYQDLFQKLENIAREAERGCWKPSPPESVVCDCSYNRYNCPNFSSHAEAQACYEYCLRKVGYDVHRLDGDNDGSACETLP